MTRPEWARRALLWALVLAVPSIGFALFGDLPGREFLLDYPRDAWGPLGALLLAADVLLPIPSTVVGSFLGYELGFWSGFAWSFVGLVVGNLCGWAAGRLALSFVHVELGAISSSLVLLATRPLPILAEAVALATGAGGVPLRAVLWPILLGNAAYALALAWSGARFKAAAEPLWLAIPLGLPLVGFLALHLWKGRRAALSRGVGQS